MFVRSVCVLVLLGSLACQAAAPIAPIDAHKKTSNKAPSMLRADVSMEHVSALACSGDAQIHMDATSKKSGVWVYSGASVMVSVEDKALVIHGGASDVKHEKSKEVIIYGAKWVNALESVTLHDRCQLHAKGYKALTRLESHTEANVHLDGIMPISDIRQTKNNQISVTWVDSDTLWSVSSAGRLFLAGKANQVRVIAKGGSRTNLQHLQASSLWLYGADESVVWSMDIPNQNVFLEGHSQWIANTPDRLNSIVRAEGVEAVDVPSVLPASLPTFLQQR